MKYLGQVFTPEHIAGFMAKLINVNESDNVLDACCGNGNLLEVAQKFGAKCFGIELDEPVYVEAKERLPMASIINNSTLDEASKKWVREQNITKVVMNPPYEDRYFCLEIVETVMDSVAPGTKCVFLLPDKKFEKRPNITKRILQKHNIEKIIKLPENIFEVGVTTSIFIFTAHKPTNLNEDVFACYIEDDGLMRVKNKGRYDVKNKWPALEVEWLNIINNTHSHSTAQWIKPDEQCLSYQMPQREMELYEEDILKSFVDYQMYLEGIDVKNFRRQVADAALYSGMFGLEYIKEMVKKPKTLIDTSSWGSFCVGDIFECQGVKGISNKHNLSEGDIPYITNSHENNGLTRTCGNADKQTKGNCITIGTVSCCGFYHRPNFVAGDGIYSIRYDNINVYNALFVCGVLNVLSDNYSYNNQRTLAKIKKEVIKLPIKSDGSINFEYMEAYAERCFVIAANKIAQAKALINAHIRPDGLTA